jgi:molybdopterin-guanine dinucleotide biosynthesis protein A
MIKIAGMLMIGAGDRKAGKTKFACSLISRFGSRREVIGIKATSIEDAASGCPRGEEGCGACSSLEGHYYIFEETNRQAEKDTSRMLSAGARRVFWLRALKPHLEEGIKALIGIIGEGAVSICESTSLRRVVEPDVFILLRSAGGKMSKASAKEAARYADRVVTFDGDKFDIGVDEIELSGGRWLCRMKATAIIMAGGGSIRMGRDKSMLPIKTEPMIKHIFEQLRPHFNQVLISTDDAPKYGFLGVEVVGDKVKGRGPLGGIASALAASANEVNFVIACDIPQVDIELVRTMVRQGSSFDAVIPRTGNKRREPLFAVYNKKVAPVIETALVSGTNRIMDALGGCVVKYIDLDDAERIRNLNTMEDYLEFTGGQADADV